MAVNEMMSRSCLEATRSLSENPEFQQMNQMMGDNVRNMRCEYPHDSSQVHIEVDSRLPETLFLGTVSEVIVVAGEVRVMVVREVQVFSSRCSIRDNAPWFGSCCRCLAYSVIHEKQCSPLVLFSFFLSCASFLLAVGWLFPTAIATAGGDASLRNRCSTWHGFGDAVSGCSPGCGEAIVVPLKRALPV